MKLQNKIFCLICNSDNVSTEDVGLTCTEHVCECEDCGNTNQAMFEERGEY